jgi:hypothetical protein
VAVSALSSFIHSGTVSSAWKWKIGFDGGTRK